MKAPPVGEAEVSAWHRVAGRDRAAMKAPPVGEAEVPRCGW